MRQISFKDKGLKKEIDASNLREDYDIFSMKNTKINPWYFYSHQHKIPSRYQSLHKTVLSGFATFCRLKLLHFFFSAILPI